MIVDSIAGRWERADALAAWLWGRCLAGLEWVKSRKTSGTCLQFRSAFKERKKVYMSEQFQKQMPDHARLLLHTSSHACSLAPKGPGGVKAPHFTVIKGQRPASESNKRISLLADAERAALPTHSKTAWGFQPLLATLTLTA